MHCYWNVRLIHWLPTVKKSIFVPFSTPIDWSELSRWIRLLGNLFTEDLRLSKLSGPRLVDSKIIFPPSFVFFRVTRVWMKALVGVRSRPINPTSLQSGIEGLDSSVLYSQPLEFLPYSRERDRKFLSSTMAKCVSQKPSLRETCHI